MNTKEVWDLWESKIEETRDDLFVTWLYTFKYAN